MATRLGAVPGLLLAVVLGAVAGCGGGDGDPPSGTTAAGTSATSEPAQTSASEEPGDGSGNGGTEDDGSTDAPPFPANTAPDTGEASEGALVSVTDIRIGRHDGFDRVVLEVDGRGTPGWEVRYVDQALSQGTGDEIEIDGDAVLQVTLTGVGYPADTGVEEYPGPDRLSAAGTEVVTELVFDSTFEGQTVSFVGTTGEVPFRVYLLEGPARVVVEVADPR